MNTVILRVLYFVTMLGCGYSQASVALDENTLKDRFVERVFPSAPKLSTLWLNKALKNEIYQKIDYRMGQLRLRYWGDGVTTAWILEEVGKEKPITFGVVVEDAKIKSIEVLRYRESRGGEIQRTFFTRQFHEAQLKEKSGRYALTERIDGITGATLSVRASKKVAKLALFLHQHTPYATKQENAQQPQKTASEVAQATGNY